MTERREPGTDDETDAGGPRGTMADVSHTPPKWSRAAADGDSPTSDLFARGGEQVGRDGDPRAATAGADAGTTGATADGPAVDPRRNGHHE